MTRYESMLITDEQNFVKNNEEIIGRFLQILERRTTKKFFELKYDDREEGYDIEELEEIRKMISIKTVNSMMNDVINGYDSIDEEG